jgi:hypothetical protein
VTIFHVGEEGDWPFIAMEFLEGESLHQRIQRGGRMPVAEVCPASGGRLRRDWPQRIKRE